MSRKSRGGGLLQASLKFSITAALVIGNASVTASATLPEPTIGDKILEVGDIPEYPELEGALDSSSDDAVMDQEDSDQVLEEDPEISAVQNSEVEGAAYIDFTVSIPRYFEPGKPLSVIINYSNGKPKWCS